MTTISCHLDRKFLALLPNFISNFLWLSRFPGSNAPALPGFIAPWWTLLSNLSIISVVKLRKYLREIYRYELHDRPIGQFMQNLQQTRYQFHSECNNHWLVQNSQKKRFWLIFVKTSFAVQKDVSNTYSF